MRRQPLNIAPSVVALRAPRISRTRRVAATRPRQGPTYVYRCTVCNRTFNRTTMDGTLNPHKHPRGYECPGRIGVYVRTKY